MIEALNNLIAGMGEMDTERVAEEWISMAGVLGDAERRVKAAKALLDQVEGELIRRLREAAAESRASSVMTAGHRVTLRLTQRPRLADPRDEAIDAVERELGGHLAKRTINPMSLGARLREVCADEVTGLIVLPAGLVEYIKIYDDYGLQRTAVGESKAAAAAKQQQRTKET